MGNDTNKKYAMKGTRSNDLSLNFSRKEFSCPCNCGFNTVDAKLLTIAEYIRNRIGAFSPVSACRCAEHNEKIGGSKKSQHLIGRAMDVHCDNPRALADHLDELMPNSCGIGVYRWGVHIDTRDTKARW